MAKQLKKKKCKYCKKEFQPERIIQPVCSYQCALAKSKEDKIKRFEKEAKKEKKEWYAENKNLSDYEAEARREFQKWVRLRDKDLGCISCGNTKATQYDGGHYLDANKYSGLIFHEDNCHKQCSRPCNKDKHGDLINYRIGLIQRIGEEKVKWLEENKDRLRVYKYTKQELTEIKNYYKQLTKELTQNT